MHYLSRLGLAPAYAELKPVSEPAAAPYYSYKIIAGGAALCVAEARTKSSNQHTINIEGAVALTGGAQKAYDWPNKIVVQLTIQECYKLLALLENKMTAVKFDGHGRTHDKSLHIEIQGSHYFAKLIQRGRAAVAVPVQPVDAIPLVSLLYKQLLANEPHLRLEDVRGMVDRMALMASR